MKLTKRLHFYTLLSIHLSEIPQRLLKTVSVSVDSINPKNFSKSEETTSHLVVDNWYGRLNIARFF